MDEGLQNALCAISFFRARHMGKKRYKKSKRHPDQVVSDYPEKVRMSRLFIQRARQAGFKGPIQIIY